jgi:response regulator RpfG family c-di-GMP phosphodiesterase
MTSMMLTRLGYTVLAANTPGEAIRLADEYQGRIDLLVTDVVMPEMNGRELADNLLSRSPKLKRLFMSGYTANVIKEHGVFSQGAHFMHKPFSMNEFSPRFGRCSTRHSHSHLTAISYARGVGKPAPAVSSELDATPQMVDHFSFCQKGAHRRPYWFPQRKSTDAGRVFRCCFHQRHI